MAKIHSLSPHIIAQIAAGEVIERPSYAVKELIENSIDAHATIITIILEESGLQKIQVIDNGEGMEKVDILESWKPHTTSKISEDSTLSAISSYGFRGEALSSLAAISNLTIKSKTVHDKSGTMISVNHAQLISCQPIGMAEGTIILIEYLFSTVPARRKFLKSKQTELRHIIDTVTQLALGHPHIHFSLVHNKKVLFNFPAVKDIRDRIKTIIGQSTYDHFLPVKNSDSYISVSGFIAKPQIHTISSRKQLIYINNRKVNDRLIASSIKEAYGTMLEPTTYPIYILFLSIPFEMVDVNVHPRKEQVHVLNPQLLFDQVKKIILEVLQDNNLTFQNLSWKRIGVGTTKSYVGTLLRKTVLLNLPDFDKEKNLMGQFYNLYIITSTEAGILLIDQHGAHERIIFEKLKIEFKNLKNNQKSFKLPYSLALTNTPSEKILIEENIKIFEKLYFKFSFINNIIELTHIPFLLKDRNGNELVREILEYIEEEKLLENIDIESHEMMAFLACRKAVKAGDVLSEEQMNYISTTIQSVPDNVTCPHGRPTKVLLSINEINHLFKR